MTAGVRRSEFDTDEKLKLALVRALQVIGESEMPWKRISGFRHRVVHEYFAVDYDVVWQIATTEMQPLIDELAPALPPPPAT